MAKFSIAAFGRRVKQIKKAHPGMSHLAAQKEASRERRTGKKKKAIGGKRKYKVSHVVKRVVKRKKKVAPRKRTVGSVASYKRAAKDILEEKLAWKLLAISSAERVRQKTKLQKEAAKIKKELRGLCL